MVSIDMPAGPSEVLVIADKHANPVHIAADLLSQVLIVIIYPIITVPSLYFSLFKNVCLPADHSLQSTHPFLSVPFSLPVNRSLYFCISVHSIPLSLSMSVSLPAPSLRLQLPISVSSFPFSSSSLLPPPLPHPHLHSLSLPPLHLSPSLSILSSQ